MTSKFVWLDLGLHDYRETWALQQELHGRAVREAKHFIITVEHPPVLTLGQHAQEGFIRMQRDDLAKQGIDVVAIDRGGEVTAHMPGQLVVYPIVNLSALGLMPKKYVCILEKSVIEVLAKYDISASIDEKFPGVWVGRDKICAVGIRIKDRCSMHGIALNISNSFALFEMIVPCGIAGRGVTSVQRCRGGQPNMKEFAQAICAELGRRLE